VQLLIALETFLFSVYFNQRIRRIDAATGIINTIIGTGANGFSGDGGDPIQAVLASPRNICIDKDGYIYINDYGNKRIRRARVAN
jgi:hypothetical protein